MSFSGDEWLSKYLTQVSEGRRLVVPGLSAVEQDAVDRLLAQLRQKYPRNFLRACRYDGKNAVRSVGAVVPPQYYRLGLVLGWEAKAVDMLHRRTTLEGFVWPGGDLDSLGLQQLWDDNFLASEFASARLTSLIHGVSFLVVTAGGPGEPDALIHTKDPLSTTGEWDSRARCLRSLLSVTGWGEDRLPTGLVLYLPGVIVSMERDGNRWKVDRRTHRYGVPAEAVVYRPRQNKVFGSSRISRPLMSIADTALRIVIRLEGHADIYSYPEFWMLGADETIFRKADGSQIPSWQVMLGRIKGIPDDPLAPSDALARAEVHQFPSASPAPHLEMLRQQAELFSGEASIPLTSLGVTNQANPTSADSYVASREDLVAEAEGTTDDWSPAFRRTILRALAVANKVPEPPKAWQAIDAQWRSPLYLSRAAQADAGVKQLSAVPWLAETSVGLELLGLSKQQVERAVAERQRLTGRLLLEEIASANFGRDRPVE